MNTFLKITASSSLVVAFAGSGQVNNPDMIKYNFQRSLKQMKLSADLLLIRDLSCCWYMNGLPGLSKGVVSTWRWLEQQHEQYEHVVYVGCSAGGYAAVLYGSLLDIDAVIAFGPQTDLNTLTSYQNEYPMIQQLASKVNKNIKNNYFNISKWINNTTQYHVHSLDLFDEKNAPDVDLIRMHDMRHFDNISHKSNVMFLPHTARQAIDNGELKRLISKYI